MHTIDELYRNADVLQRRLKGSPRVDPNSIAELATVVVRLITLMKDSGVPSINEPAPAEQIKAEAAKDQ
jgi:hypothetical protein